MSRSVRDSAQYLFSRSKIQIVCWGDQPHNSNHQSTIVSRHAPPTNDPMNFLRYMLFPSNPGASWPVYVSSSVSMSVIYFLSLYISISSLVTIYPLSCDILSWDEPCLHDNLFRTIFWSTPIFSILCCAMYRLADFLRSRL